MKKILLSIIFLVYSMTSSFAETITLTKCFTASDSDVGRFSGPWVNVWGVKNSFDPTIFEKNQFVFDLKRKELIQNYRFTENYHKILD